MSLISALWSRLTSPAFRRKPAISISPQDSTFGQPLLFPATFSFPLLISFASWSLCVYGFPFAHRFSCTPTVLSSTGPFRVTPCVRCIEFRNLRTYDDDDEDDDDGCAQNGLNRQIKVGGTTVRGWMRQRLLRTGKSI